MTEDMDMTVDIGALVYAPRYSNNDQESIAQQEQPGKDSRGETVEGNEGESELKRS